MNEGIEYAEMLEIPVATVNVVQKKRRRARDLKSQAVGKVNERMESRRNTDDPAYAGNDPPATEENDLFSGQTEDVQGVERVNAGAETVAKRTHPALIVEFALACILCATIFLTNVFVNDSAINTFLRSVLNGNATAETVKTYSDFKLTPVVSEYADVQVSLSDAGVLSFTGKCGVYPACDGSIKEISKADDGTYTVSIAHSASFESVFTGVSAVYVSKGETVLSNVPFASSDGNAAVRVSFYQDGQMLNCYSVDAENCLSWNL